MWVQTACGGDGPLRCGVDVGPTKSWEAELIYVLRERTTTVEGRCDSVNNSHGAKIILCVFVQDKVGARQVWIGSGRAQALNSSRIRSTYRVLYTPNIERVCISTSQLYRGVRMS